YPLLAGIPKADLIFNLVFFISITSVLLQGTTLAFVAKILHVSVPIKAKRRIGTDFETSDKEKNELDEIFLDKNSPAVGKQIVELAIPPTVNILTIKRKDAFITPTGSTTLLDSDILYVLAEDRQAVDNLSNILNNT
ncbi:MAG TPA: TrkA C-terminal domain-containing protein, partial [Chryseolinea sp.]|nr:TrkA C-terminal domain-containing protein [Chryseolinea sp.]